MKRRPLACSAANSGDADRDTTPRVRARPGSFENVQRDVLRERVGARRHPGVRFDRLLDERARAQDPPEAQAGQRVALAQRVRDDRVRIAFARDRQRRRRTSARDRSRRESATPVRRRAARARGRASRLAARRDDAAVGLHGEQITIARVRSPIAATMRSASNAKSSSSRIATAAHGDALERRHLHVRRKRRLDDQQLVAAPDRAAS